MTDLIKNQPIKFFVEARNAILEKVKQIKQIEKEITLILNSANIQYIYANELSKSVQNNYQTDNFDYSETIKLVDKCFWLTILEQLKLSTSMTENAKKQLYNKLNNNPPKFNLEEIKKIVANIKAIYGNNVMQTIKEVYNKLIGCYYKSTDWNIKKRDNLKEVKKQFRISGNIYWSDYGSLAGRWEMRDYTNYFNFEDFYTVCKILDGQSCSDYSNTFNVFAKEQLRDSNEIKTKYFNVRLYKNGNQLITWTSYGEKIRVLLNRYGSSGRLPDTMGKRYKKEHFI